MTTKWREEFIARASKLGLHYETQIRPLLRLAATLDRLAVAQCNGDWPADNGERKTAMCPLCESFWVPSVLTRGLIAKSDGTTARSTDRVCPDCRTSARVWKVLAGSGWRPVFGGDPRGCVLKIARETCTAEDISNGRAESRGDEIGVPA